MKTLLFGLITCCLVLAEESSAMPIYMGGYGGVAFTMEALVGASDKELNETMELTARGNVEEKFTDLLLEQPESPNDANFVVPPEHLRIYRELLRRQPYYAVPWIGAYLAKNKFFAESVDWESYRHFEWAGEFSKEQLALARLRAEKILISIAKFNMRDLIAVPETARKKIIKKYVWSGVNTIELARILLDQQYDKDFIVTPQHLKIYEEIWGAQENTKLRGPSYSHMFAESIKKHSKFVSDEWDRKSPTWATGFTREEHELIIQRAQKILTAIEAQETESTKGCKGKLVRRNRG